MRRDEAIHLRHGAEKSFLVSFQITSVLNKCVVWSAFLSLDNILKILLHLALKLIALTYFHLSNVLRVGGKSLGSIFFFYRKHNTQEKFQDFHLYPF